MQKQFTFLLTLNVEIPDDASRENVLQAIRQQLADDGLPQYINEDNNIGNELREHAPNKKKLDSMDKWFFNLEYKQLKSIFDQPLTVDDNEYIDKCDELWRGYSFKEKESVFNNYQGRI